MPLDPLAQRFLQMLATGRNDARDETAAERRIAYEKLMRFSRAREASCVVENLDIDGPGGPLPLRIHSPAASASARLPALVFFHGGGLVAGSLDGYDGLCAAIAVGSRCRVVSAGYRLAPEHRYPSAVLDSLAATRFVAAQADALAIDRERLAVGGDSAGGTLAALVCQMARTAGAPRIALQLLLCPVLDCLPGTPSRRDFAKGYLIDEKTMARDLEHYLPPCLDPADPRLSPLRARDLSGLPPAIIHTAEFDPLRDEGMAYADRLSEAGVAVDHTCHQGMIHHFYALDGVVPAARDALDQIARDFGAKIRDASAAS